MLTSMHLDWLCARFKRPDSADTTHRSFQAKKFFKEEVEEIELGEEIELNGERDVTEFVMIYTAISNAFISYITAVLVNNGYSVSAAAEQIYRQKISIMKFLEITKEDSILDALCRLQVEERSEILNSHCSGFDKSTEECQNNPIRAHRSSLHIPSPIPNLASDSSISSGTTMCNLDVGCGSCSRGTANEISDHEIKARDEDINTVLDCMDIKLDAMRIATDFVLLVLNTDVKE